MKTLVIAALLAAPPLSAQTPRTHAPPTVVYGKWAAAALAVGFTALGVRAHNQADANFQNLLDYCGTTGCQTSANGRYADPAAESRYGSVVSSDRAARAWFIGGQVALAGAITLFVMELKHADRDPRNVPYSGLIIAPGRFGLRLPL